MCQNGTLPDREHSKCLELPEKYLRLNSFWAIGAMTFALIGIIMTIGIFVVFIRYVKAKQFWILQLKMFSPNWHWYPPFFSHLILLIWKPMLSNLFMIPSLNYVCRSKNSEGNNFFFTFWSVDPSVSDPFCLESRFFFMLTSSGHGTMDLDRVYTIENKQMNVSFEHNTRNLPGWSFL